MTDIFGVYLRAIWFINLTSGPLTRITGRFDACYALIRQAEQQYRSLQVLTDSTKIDKKRKKIPKKNSPRRRRFFRNDHLYSFRSYPLLRRIVWLIPRKILA